MSSARVVLRYRPGADVLTGSVHVPGGDEAADESVDTPDADTTLTWRGGVLASFQLVFAAARTGQGPLPIPAALWPAADSLIVTALHAVDEVADLGARMRARAEATCEVPVEALARPAPADAPGAASPPGSPHQRALDRRATERLSRSLSQLADAVHTRVPVDDDVEALHTDHLARLLRELSTTLHLHDTAAPGATAATRVAARAGDALRPAELELLEVALTELDDPSAWAHAGDSLEQLIGVISNLGRSDLPRVQSATRGRIRRRVRGKVSKIILFNSIARGSSSRSTGLSRTSRSASARLPQSAAECLG